MGLRRPPMARICPPLPAFGPFEQVESPVMTRRLTAGRRLRRDLDRALDEAAAECGEVLVWTQTDLQMIGLMCAAADRADALRDIWESSLASGVSASTLTKLSGEIRQCERQIAGLLDRLDVGLQGSWAKQQRKRASRSRGSIAIA